MFFFIRNRIRILPPWTLIHLLGARRPVEAFLVIRPPLIFLRVSICKALDCELSNGSRIFGIYEICFFFQKKKLKYVFTRIKTKIPNEKENFVKCLSIDHWVSAFRAFLLKQMVTVDFRCKNHESVCIAFAIKNVIYVFFSDSYMFTDTSTEENLNGACSIFCSISHRNHAYHTSKINNWLENNSFQVR